jgi:DNA mismatch repair protein MutS
MLELTDVWHPLIDQNVVISNNVVLGGSHPTKDMLITGPNAGGKSTALKSIALGAILAQSFGIVPAKKAVLTPFCAINTYLNIPDSVGQESLFQAEMRRAHELFSSLENLDGNRFALSIMDEIFTGTNPEEGEAGARGVAYNLALLNNSINIVTTHYKGLTTLEDDTNGVIKNFKVSVIEDTEGNITPTYKLERGISHQRVALKLLKKSGFNKNIINTAYAAFNKKQQGQQKITA